jgi:3-hydroxybutyryl-CoA dehydrogenase
MVSEIKKVTVFGAGTMGNQIAFRTAKSGYEVTLHDVSAEQLAKARELFSTLLAKGQREKENASSDAQSIMGRISFSDNLEEAVKDSDLVCESIYENIQAKTDLFTKLGKACPEKTIITTNSSSFLPSMFAEASGRPDRFLAFHFHELTRSSIVDLMVHPSTSKAAIDALFSFAKSIGQIPVLIEKESVGYIFNRMLGAINDAAIDLVLDGVASVEEVDRCWMGVNHQPIGPFGQIDRIGLDTLLSINSFWAENLNDDLKRRRVGLLKSYVEKGRTGVKAGKGFYDYPNPTYSKPDFVTGQ